MIRMVITGIIDPSRDDLAEMWAGVPPRNPSLSQEPRRGGHGPCLIRKQCRSLSPLVTDFLAELAHANRSRHTCRAYATDLAQFTAFYQGPVGGITAEVIRGFGATLERLRPASRARKQAALASFLELGPPPGPRRLRPDGLDRASPPRPSSPSVVGS